jgi:sialic acid synthase SpsE
MSDTNAIFKDLFVLEMTNNHLGRLDRGLQIVSEFSKVVRFNGVKAAIKLQFRDIDNFVHKDYRDRKDIRYIRRTLDTAMSNDDYRKLVHSIRQSNMIPMSTPFDEKSVDFCEELDLPIIKVASADNNDWTLLHRIAKTNKPVIVSLGGLSLKDTDDLVSFFEHRNIPLAINHCIATYPTKDGELQLNQIDFLRNRYPNHIIGLSTHEQGGSELSVAVAYAKGARTFEKHIDILTPDVEIAKYSSTPSDIDSWFKSWHRAQTVCGSSGVERVLPMESERSFLDNYVRGVYFKRYMKAGEFIDWDDIYMAIPILKGQISCRELLLGQYGFVLTHDCDANAPLMVDDIDCEYARDENMKQNSLLYRRGL